MGVRRGENWFEPIEVLDLQMRLNGVSTALLVQHGVPQHGHWGHDYLFECCERFPQRFAVIVIVDVAQPDAPQTLAEWAARGAVGVRLAPDMRSPGPDPLAIWRAASELNLVVSVMGGGEQLGAEFREPTPTCARQRLELADDPITLTLTDWSAELRVR